MDSAPANVGHVEDNADNADRHSDMQLNNGSNSGSISTSEDDEDIIEHDDAHLENNDLPNPKRQRVAEYEHNDAIHGSESTVFSEKELYAFNFICVNLTFLETNPFEPLLALLIHRHTSLKKKTYKMLQVMYKDWFQKKSYGEKQLMLKLFEFQKDDYTITTEAFGLGYFDTYLN
jgi:hypothetical protein